MPASAGDAATAGTAAGGPVATTLTGATERRIAVLVVVLAGAALWIAHAWIAIRGTDRTILSYDSAQYALAGRFLAEHGRLATPYAYVGTLRDGAGPPFPLLAGHPLVPLLVAPLFRLFGAHAPLVLLPTAIAYLVTIACAALLVLRCGGSAWLAAIAGVALAAVPGMLESAADGASDMPFAAAWTGALLVLADLRRSPRPFRLGVCLGLAHLARPAIVPALPAWIAAAMLAAPAGRRLRTAAALLGGFAPFAASLLIYKWMATGSPFTDVGGIILLTDLAPGFEAGNAARLLHPPDAMGWIRAHPGALLHKLAGTLPLMLGQAIRLGGWATGLAFTFWVLRPRRDGEGPLRLAAGGGLALLVLLAALTLPRAVYLFPALPASIAFGALALDRGSRLARLPARASAALLAAVLAWSTLRPLLAEWVEYRRTARPVSAFHEREVARLGAAVAERVPPGTLVASDMAPWVSWFAGLPSVNLPLRISDLDELRARHRLGAVVITNEYLISLPGTEDWQRAFAGEVLPPGWRSTGLIVAGGLRARLLLPI